MGVECCNVDIGGSVNVGMVPTSLAPLRVAPKHSIILSTLFKGSCGARVRTACLRVHVCVCVCVPSRNTCHSAAVRRGSGRLLGLGACAYSMSASARPGHASIYHEQLVYLDCCFTCTAWLLGRGVRAVCVPCACPREWM